MDLSNVTLRSWALDSELTGGVRVADAGVRAREQLACADPWAPFPHPPPAPEAPPWPEALDLLPLPRPFLQV